MDGHSGNSTWGNPEHVFGENNSVPPDTVDSSSIANPVLFGLSLFDQYPTWLFESSMATAGGTSMGPNVEAPHTLIPGSTETATTNHHRPIYGHVVRDPNQMDIIPAHRGRTGVRARRSRRNSVSASRPNPQRFRCGWQDCDYNGTFGRKAELMRHIDSKHVSPGAFRCPLPGCGSVFNRRDNLEEHWLRVHQRN